MGKEGRNFLSGTLKITVLYQISTPDISAVNYYLMLNLKYTLVQEKYVGLLMSSLCNKNKLVIFFNLLDFQIILKIKMCNYLFCSKI